MDYKREPILLKRGNTEQHVRYNEHVKQTEITYNTDTNTAQLHDGVTVGGQTILTDKNFILDSIDDLPEDASYGKVFIVRDDGVYVWKERWERLYENNIASIEEQFQLLVTANEALASHILSLDAQVESSHSRITMEEIVRSTDTEALARTTKILNANIKEVDASVKKEEIARVTTDEALASDISNLTAKINDINTGLEIAHATIDEESTVRATQTEASAIKLTELESAIGNSSSRIQHEMISSVTRDTALAEEIVSLESKIEGELSGYANAIQSLNTSVTKLEAETIYVWTGEVTIPTNTTITNAYTITFNSAVEGSCYIEILAKGAEGGGKVALNNIEIGTLDGTDRDSWVDNNTKQWFKIFSDNLIIGQNTIKIWSTNDDVIVIETVNVIREAGIVSISEAVTNLHSEIINNRNVFNGFLIYEFISTVENWTSLQSTINVVEEGILTFLQTGSDARIISPNFSINGKLYPIIQLRLKTSTGEIPCQIFYSTNGGHGHNSNYVKNFTITGSNDWQTIDLDMKTLTLGNNDWINSTITNIRIDFGSTLENRTIYIDWIGIGSYNSINSSGQANAINILNTSVSMLEAATPFEWAGSQAWPLNTTLSGAYEWEFTSPIYGDATIEIYAYDAQNVNVALNGTIIGTMSGEPAEYKWYSFSGNLLTGENKLAVWSPGFDNGAIKQIRVHRIATVAATASSLLDLESQVNDPTTGLPNAHSRITSEASTRATADSALASSINTLSTTVGGHTTTLTQQASSIDGIKGRWGVSINASGHVTAIQLIGSASSSQFIIDADVIINGTLTTEKIEDNAITVPQIYALTSGSYGVDETVTVTVNVDCPIYISCSFTLPDDNLTGDIASVFIIYVNGSKIYQEESNSGNVRGFNISDMLSAGSNTVRFVIRRTNSTAYGTGYLPRNIFLNLLGVQK